MKFYAGLAMALILIMRTANAQNSIFEVKSGLNLNNIDNPTRYDIKTGVLIGMLLQIHEALHFALQSELLYTAQGTKFSVGIGGDVELNLDHANAPVFLNFNNHEE